ncbi:MAG: MBOAT family protein [Clostridium sp.]|nr:MBOAT family protein [Clostridium sp.]
MNHFHRYTLAKAFLFGMSLWFYGYFHAAYLALLLGSILWNYMLYRIAKRRLQQQKSTKTLMIFGVICNVAVLAWFKYTDFFLANMNTVLGTDVPLRRYLLPLGISFFTFQQIGFIVDACRGETGDYALLDYALFVSFFPQLIAGPIVTHEELVPQFADKEKKAFRADNFSAGSVLFIVGLAKKVLLADTFGRAVTWGYGAPGELNTPAAVIVMLSFYFQIYFDFSGYSDMALGLGRMMNLKLPVNFDSPYQALTLREYWKRWHITLTRFFTKYVYIPLGGSRGGRLRTYRNILIVFMLSGLWHGADWGFVLWGILNGVGIILCRVLDRPITRIARTWIGKAALWVGNLFCVNLLWVLFRAENLHTAGAFFAGLFRGFGAVPQKLLETFRVGEFWYLLKLLHVTDGGRGDLILCVGFLLAGFLLVLCMKNIHRRMEDFRPRAGYAFGLGILFLWCFVSLSGVSTFLYYNF